MARQIKTKASDKKYLTVAVKPMLRVALTVLFSFQLFYSGADASDTLALKRSGGALAVDATINDAAAVCMVVDSGASLTMISERTAGMLGLKDNRDAPMVPLTTPSGYVWVRLIALDSVRVGSVIMRDVETAINGGNLKNSADALGASFLDGLVYKINPRKKTLSLKPSGPDGPLFDGFDEKWWRGRFQRYSNAIERYQSYRMTLEGAMVVKGKSSKDKEAGFTKDNLSRLEKFYKRLLDDLEQRAKSLGVPEAWRVNGQ